MSVHVNNHTRLAKFFHWSFALLFVYGLAKQVDEVEELDDMAFLREEVVFAVVFLAFLALRFLYMRKQNCTALPEASPPLVQALAKAVHLGMYLSLAALGATGLMIAGLYGNGFKDGIALAIVLWFHEASYWASVATIALHISGAVFHRYAGDGVWSSMVPLLKER
ncbi:MAG: cytochrome b/b6 domain-containing protein [Pseudomonadota bacterium]